MQGSSCRKTQESPVAEVRPFSQASKNLSLDGPQTSDRGGPSSKKCLATVVKNTVSMVDKEIFFTKNCNKSTEQLKTHPISYSGTSQQTIGSNNIQYAINNEEIKPHPCVEMSNASNLKTAHVLACSDWSFSSSEDQHINGSSTAVKTESHVENEVFSSNANFSLKVNEELEIFGEKENMLGQRSAKSELRNISVVEIFPDNIGEINPATSSRPASVSLLSTEINALHSPLVNGIQVQQASLAAENCIIQKSLPCNKENSCILESRENIIDQIENTFIYNPAKAEVLVTQQNEGAGSSLSKSSQNLVSNPETPKLRVSSHWSTPLSPSSSVCRSDISSTHFGCRSKTTQRRRLHLRRSLMGVSVYDQHKLKSETDEEETNRTLMAAIRANSRPRTSVIPMPTGQVACIDLDDFFSSQSNH